MSIRHGPEEITVSASKTTRRASSRNCGQILIMCNTGIEVCSAAPRCASVVECGAGHLASIITAIAVEFSVGVSNKTRKLFLNCLFYTECSLL